MACDKCHKSDALTCRWTKCCEHCGSGVEESWISYGDERLITLYGNRIDGNFCPDCLLEEYGDDFDEDEKDLLRKISRLSRHFASSNTTLPECSFHASVEEVQTLCYGGCVVFKGEIGFLVNCIGKTLSYNDESIEDYIPVTMTRDAVVAAEAEHITTLGDFEVWGYRDAWTPRKSINNTTMEKLVQRVNTLDTRPGPQDQAGSN